MRSIKTMGYFPFLFFVLNVCASAAHADSENWQAHWAIPPGYFLEVDSTGYSVPVAIAMVPNPGSAPDSPIYYVAELGGRIAVVRNDRQVETFADGFYTLNRSAEMPDLGGVIGLTGLCLDKDTGYLFATYVHDVEGGRYNGITRFATNPDTFSLRPTETFDIHKPFMLGESEFTRLPFGHQIGQCQIIDNKLYVGIGDGELTHRSRSAQSSFGKIMWMQFDGSPVAESNILDHGALTQAPDANSLANYLFSSGLRNPFGQTQVGDNIVVADNGPGVDRVLTVRKNRDYLYDGSDASIATNAMVLYSPAKGTANIAFYPEGAASGITQLENNLLVVLSGVPETYIEEEPAEISAFEVEVDSALVISRPRTLVKYVGKEMQVLSSIAIGRDGIYFAPVYGENAVPGISNVYRLSWAPEKSYPTSIGQYQNARAIMRNYGCRGCHNVFGDGGNVAPTLNATHLRRRNSERLASEEYASKLRQMIARGRDSTDNRARQRVLNADGDKRLSVWTEEKILNPTFDNPESVMPLLGVSKREAEILAKFLLNDKKRSNGQNSK
ncbi:PQQ-dependent sugar dehydrogenase [bacterium]|nr:PQQ-dependent sugar dehydrogenase [bacterium]